jgi:hypothetical protein
LPIEVKFNGGPRDGAIELFNTVKSATFLLGLKGLVEPVLEINSLLLWKTARAEYRYKIVSSETAGEWTKVNFRLESTAKL